jgi:leucyl aminopeptidase (aminopeptidase T)
MGTKAWEEGRPTSRPDIEDGIRNFLFDYLGVVPGNALLFLMRHERRELCEAVAEVAKGYGCLCTTMPSNTSFESLREAIHNHDTIVYLEGTESAHSKEVLAYLATEPEPPQRFFRVFDFSTELLSEAFRISRADLQRLNDSIIARGWRTSKVTVRSDLGTDLHIHLDNKYGWINSSGLFCSRKPGVLPPAEVATYSPAVSGVLYADGAINTNFGFPIDPRLAEHPVRIELEDSRVVSAQCEYPMIDYFLQKFFKVTNADRVGEIGFGTNIGLTRFVPFVSHINERFPSLHLGFGANNQGPPRVEWTCPMHLDLIFDRCEVYFDGELILRDREYTSHELLSVSDLEQVPIGYTDTV